MAEITRQDIISDDALTAPLILAKNLMEAIGSLDQFIKKAQESSRNISSAGSTTTIRKETEALTLEQKELIKIQNQIATAVAKNNDVYRQQEKQLQSVKRELKEKSKIGELDALVVNKQNASEVQLRAALEKNKVAWANLRNEEARTSKEGQHLLSVIQRQDKEVKELNGTMGNFKDNVGNYPNMLSSMSSAFSTIAPGAASAAQGIMGMVKASLAFIATPIGAIIAALGAALYALTAYFRGSEEGQNRLNKIVAVGSAIFEQFMNVVEAVGEVVYNAISNPKEAIIEFGKLIKENIINRFEGMLEFIPAIAKSVKLLFEGEFAKAGKVAADAAIKMSLGIENATDKIQNLVDETIKMVDKGVALGTRLADLEADIDKRERSLIVNRAKTALAVAKLREEAVKLEGSAKRKAIEEAISLEKQLSDKEVEFAEIRMQLAALRVEANGNDKEALKELAQAQADYFDAQRTAYDNTLRFQKQLEALNEKKKKDGDDEKKRREKEIQDLMMRYQIEYNLAKAQLDAKVGLIKEEVLQGAKTKKEGDKEILALEKSLTDEYVQIQIDRVSKVLGIANLEASERLKVEEELQKLKVQLQDAYYQQVQDKENNNLEKTQEFIGRTQEIYSNFSQSAGELFNSLTEGRLQNIEAEEEALKSQMENELLAAGENEEAKSEIKNKFARKEADLERQKSQIQRRQAVFDKATSAVQAAIATSLAIAKALPNIPLSIAVGIAGAIQVGAILAKPIPAFAKGGTHKGGLLLAGEEGIERVDVPGQAPFLTPSGPTIMDLPAGTKITRHEETMKQLAKGQINYSEFYDRKKQADYSVEIIKGFKSLEKVIKTKKEVHWSMSKGDIKKAYRNSQTMTYFLENYYK